MSDPRIKVNDRRLFTPAGELREEYRYLEGRAQAEAPSQAAPSPPSPQPAAPQTQPAAPRPAAQPTPPEPEDDFGGASFFDLLGLLANPVPMLLQQARYGGPEAAESLELAQLHVDLLGLLRQKTAGNLDPQERAALDDVLYRLRMGFVGG